MTRTRTIDNRPANTAPMAARITVSAEALVQEMNLLRKENGALNRKLSNLRSDMARLQAQRRVDSETIDLLRQEVGLFHDVCSVAQRRNVAERHHVAAIRHEVIVAGLQWLEIMDMDAPEEDAVERADDALIKALGKIRARGETGV